MGKKIVFCNKAKFKEVTKLIARLEPMPYKTGNNYAENTHVNDVKNRPKIDHFLFFLHKIHVYTLFWSPGRIVVRAYTSQQKHLPEIPPM